MSRAKAWARVLRHDAHAIYLASRDPRLLIVPLGIWLVIALIPEDLMREYRAMASAAAQPAVSKATAIIIVAVWISGAALLGWMTFVRWRV